MSDSPGPFAGPMSSFLEWAAGIVFALIGGAFGHLLVRINRVEDESRTSIAAMRSEMADSRDAADKGRHDFRNEIMTAHMAMRADLSGAIRDLAVRVDRTNDSLMDFLSSARRPGQ